MDGKWGDCDPGCPESGKILRARPPWAGPPQAGPRRAIHYYDTFKTTHMLNIVLYP